MLKGIAVSSGIVVGKVYKLVQPEIVLKEEKGETSAELAAFKAAVAKTRTDIEKIKERAAGKLKPEELEIFDAHLTMLDDPEYQGQIEAKINDGSNADLATKEVTDMMVNMFSMMDDAYFKERAADIKDVGSLQVTSRHQIQRTWTRSLSLDSVQKRVVGLHTRRSWLDHLRYLLSLAVRAS